MVPIQANSEKEWWFHIISKKCPVASSEKNVVYPIGKSIL